LTLNEAHDLEVATKLARLSLAFSRVNRATFEVDEIEDPDDDDDEEDE